MTTFERGGQSSDGPDDAVRVDGELITGVPAAESPHVVVYKGIPFAAPPVGELRWKPPQPVAPWKGVRNASVFGPTCPQQPYPAGCVFPEGTQLDRFSEDCLYLNVWTAGTAATEPRPVLVWIHGGAMIRGAGSCPVYDGAALAEKGAVVVTINYRLGAFGLLAPPELTAESEHRASCNYALLDQVAALGWVKRNIRGFGGDPGRVTIFGQSAGSSSSASLCASPLARGLFHGAIGESGGAFVGMPPLKQAEGSGAKWASSFADGSLAALREKSAEEILGATPPANLFFSFNVDGWALPRDFTTTFAEGAQNDVPTMVGYNADEMTALAPFAPTSAEAYIEATRRQYGALTDDFLKIYPVRGRRHAGGALRERARLVDRVGGALLGEGGDRDRQVKGVLLLLHPRPARPGQPAVRRIPQCGDRVRVRQPAAATSMAGGRLRSLGRHDVVLDQLRDLRRSEWRGPRALAGLRHRTGHEADTRRRDRDPQRCEQPRSELLRHLLGQGSEWRAADAALAETAASPAPR